MSQLFPENEQALSVNGPVGLIECIAAPARGEPKNITAVICHPHPQMGGTMTNKVVHTVARALRDIGCRTVRFNFRGVAGSEGEFDNAVGEIDDLMAVLQWVNEQFPGKAVLLAGFSFGSFVAASGLSRCFDRGIDVKSLILVAPPVHHMPFDALPLFQRPVLVVQGDEDEIVPANLVFEWLDNLKYSGAAATTGKPLLIRLPEAGHFFHGKLTFLKDIITLNALEVAGL